MSASTAIGMVGESLRNLLIEEMYPDATTSTNKVTLLPPDQVSEGSKAINLFLYSVQENPFLKNLDWQTKREDTSKISPPPLSLNLYYLMTAYAPIEEDTGNTEAHNLLGEAMRVFYENSIVPEDNLVEGLKDAPEQIKIMLSRLDLDELSRVWSTFTNNPLRLSVLYEISVVQIDQGPEQERDMPKRVREIGIPQISAPFNPPTVDNMTPQSGPVGTTVTFTGENLVGWKAYVTMSKQWLTPEEEQPLSDNTFTVIIPQQQTGFHQIQVDISGLFRRTFFFEVTS